MSSTTTLDDSNGRNFLTRARSIASTIANKIGAKGADSDHAVFEGMTWKELDEAPQIVSGMEDRSSNSPSSVTNDPASRQVSPENNLQNVFPNAGTIKNNSTVVANGHQDAITDTGNNPSRAEKMDSSNLTSVGSAEDEDEDIGDQKG